MQSHVDRVLAKKGLVKKSANQRIGKCFYRSLKYFNRCVKKVDKLPEALSHYNDDEAAIAKVIKLVMKLAKEHKMKQWKKRRGGN